MLQSQKTKICRHTDALLQKTGGFLHVFGFLQIFAGFLQLSG